MFRWCLKEINSPSRNWIRRSRKVLPRRGWMFDGYCFLFPLIHVEPVAAGSGIPQVKCYLNGVKVYTVLCNRIKALSNVQFRRWSLSSAYSTHVKTGQGYWYIFQLWGSTCGSWWDGFTVLFSCVPDPDDYFTDPDPRIRILPILQWLLKSTIFITPYYW